MPWIGYQLNYLAPRDQRPEEQRQGLPAGPATTLVLAARYRDMRARSVVPHVAVLAVVVAGAMFYTSGGGDPKSRTTVSLSAMIVGDDSTWSELEAYEALRDAGDDFVLHADCSNVTFAFCGRATCRLNGDAATATCGCKRVTNDAGRIGVSISSALITFPPDCHA